MVIPCTTQSVWDVKFICLPMLTTVFIGEINAAAHITVWKNICIFAANEMLFILYW
ncbi:hypothetical protein HMPREF9151_01746 [Hoylesella saccharolytica F0055]|uniref:Uncharacterized protein n=1 Tax=Hoylesella saccharolytica F0055 TaxID=1127699 RepID=L1N7V3_9BACT|nr:hypothetical protein HMPREF9151_01746 [Hoylesella saccharolytica F0055]